MKETCGGALSFKSGLGHKSNLLFSTLRMCQIFRCFSERNEDFKSIS